MGVMPVLKHLPIKISEFLHTVHGDKSSSLGPPPRGGPTAKSDRRSPTLLQLDQLFERIEFVGNGQDKTVIVLHGGVSIGCGRGVGSSAAVGSRPATGSRPARAAD